MLNIPAERKHIFNSAAYMVERKLLDLQTYIVAHRQKLRYVCIGYAEILSAAELSDIEKEINKMYDLLEVFCNQYSVDKLKTTMQSELMVKSNFLWEDLTGAISLRGYRELDKEIAEDYTQRMNTMIDLINHLIQQLTNKFNYANNKG